MDDFLARCRQTPGLDTMGQLYRANISRRQGSLHFACHGNSACEMLTDHDQTPTLLAAARAYFGPETTLTTEDASPPPKKTQKELRAIAEQDPTVQRVMNRLGGRITGVAHKE